jgi:hypothetical protein
MLRMVQGFSPNTVARASGTFWTSLRELHGRVGTDASGQRSGGGATLNGVFQCDIRGLPRAL